MTRKRRKAKSAKKAPAAKRRSAIARANGRKGGRPRSSLPKEVLDRLGPLPTESDLKRSEWVQNLLHELLVLQATGKVDRELVASLRTTMSLLDSMRAPALQAELERLTREAEDDIDAEQLGPQPQPKEARAGTPVRRDPR